MKGSAFVAATRGLSLPDRERAVWAARASWMVGPMVEVPVAHGGATGSFLATADVFAIGEPDDFVRVPLSGPLAQAVADALGLVLITPAMSDAIWRAATRKLAPHPLPPAAAMVSVDYFARHNAIVETSLAMLSAKGGILAGHKKDVVVGRAVAQHPAKVVIYGWHLGSGKPIQPVFPRADRPTASSYGHELTYADYSHGARFAGATMRVGNEARRVVDVLGDPAVAGLLSAEGALSPAALRYPAPAWDLGELGGAPLPAVLVPSTPPPSVVAQRPPVVVAHDGADFEGVRFLQAAHRTPTGAHGRDVWWAVLHSTENDCKAGVAAAVARMFAGGEREASAHLVIGPDEAVQCVRLIDVAWAAQGANAHGVHVEHAGRAGSPAAGWESDAAAAMLERSAGLVAQVCRRYDLPRDFVDAEGLLRGERGITTHAEVSRAGRLAAARGIVSGFSKSTHWDPGPAFPIERYLELVRGA